jgi:hypothetical protein
MSSDTIMRALDSDCCISSGGVTRDNHGPGWPAEHRLSVGSVSRSFIDTPEFRFSSQISQQSLVRELGFL